MNGTSLRVRRLGNMVSRRFTIAGAALAISACAVIPAAPPVGSNQAQSSALATSGYRMFEALRDDAGSADNTFISPVSIQQALGLVHPGARGETAAQIERLLGLPAGAAFDTALRSQRLAVSGKAGKTEVKLANALWLGQQFGFDPAYLAAAKADYAATAERLDFAHAPKPAADRINGWAKDQTNGLISNVVDSSGLNDSTLAILTNAVFFEGSWATEFNTAAPQPFLFGDGQTRPFPLMSKTAAYAYAEADGWQAVRLPYISDNRFAMDVYLPLRRGATAKLSATTFQRLSAALDQAQPQEVAVTLPKFEISWKESLKDVLARLGMRDAFDDLKADLSGLVSPASRGPVISGVTHLTRLQVFETGTRAAAITSIDIMVTGTRINGPKIFTADQPFHLALRETRSGSVLFVGRIAQPELYQGK